MRALRFVTLLVSATAACSSRELTAITEAKGEAWCERNTTERTLYCRDFEDGGAYYEGWPATYFRPERLGTLTSVAPTSPDDSRYLAFDTPELGVDDRLQDQLHYLTDTESGIRVRFDGRVAAFDPNLTDLTLLSIYPGADMSWKLGVDFVQGWMQLSESQGERDGNPGSFLAHKTVRPNLDQWHTFEVVLNRSADDWELTVVLDGEAAIGPVTVSPPVPLTSVKAVIGLDMLHGPAQPMSVAFDNIMFLDSSAP